MSRIFLILSIFLIGCKGKFYRMPSESMEETIKVGEPFYVNKSAAYRRNDLVVFSVYSDDYAAGPDENGLFPKHWEERCYRLIAISGDSLVIRNNVVFINNKAISFPPGCKLIYHLYSPSVIDDPLIEENINVNGSKPDPAETGFITEANLSVDQLKELRSRHPEIKKAEPFIPTYNSLDTLFARPAPDQHWNAGNYGPLYIPRRGETIEVTDQNFKLYQHIPGIKKGSFTIPEPLYFVMGDNRHYAQDSRFIGFIAHSNMHGIVK